MSSFRIISFLERRGLLLAGCVTLLAAAGCKKETPPAETKTEEAKAPTTDKKDSHNKPRDEGVEVPTEEDFEIEVEKQIQGQ